MDAYEEPDEGGPSAFLEVDESVETEPWLADEYYERPPAVFTNIHR